mmetsp:Transcript_28396/g.60559  ORF Transcript_28396/g.60559 Transcript_28396/m.60559 type:complete len:121 (-) Transcript_28396:1415-1777(-)
MWRSILSGAVPPLPGSLRRPLPQLQRSTQSNTSNTSNNNNNNLTMNLPELQSQQHPSYAFAKNCRKAPERRRRHQDRLGVGQGKVPRPRRRFMMMLQTPSSGEITTLPKSRPSTPGPTTL